MRNLRVPHLVNPLSKALSVVVLCLAFGTTTIAAAEPSAPATISELSSVAESSSGAGNQASLGTATVPLPVTQTNRYASIPLLYVENVGQLKRPAPHETPQFVVAGQNGILAVYPDSILITALEGQRDHLQPFDSLVQPSQKDRAGVNVRISFVGANSNAKLEGFNPLDTTVSYFIGNDPAGWHTDVPAWGGIRYVDLYPEVDLELVGSDGRWGWRLVTHNSEAALSVQAGPQFKIEGAQLLPTNGQSAGFGRLRTSLGDFNLPQLTVESSQTHQSKIAAAKITGDTLEISETSVASAQQTELMTLDGPESLDLTFATYFGPNAGEIAVDSTGAIYLQTSVVAGGTSIPTTPGAFRTTAVGAEDTAVSKLNATGTGLIYSTYLGGTDNDYVGGIDVDANGYAYVAGQTLGSNSFPKTTGAFQTISGDNADAFITKLNTNGTALVYSTLLGGSTNTSGAIGDGATDIAVDSTGAVYVIGGTWANDFPIIGGAFQPTYGGSDDAFAVKLNPAGNNLDYSTYLGGFSGDVAGGLQIDSNGNAYITGITRSINFPLQNAFDDECSDCPTAPLFSLVEGFVLKLNPSGSDILYSSYVGGDDVDSASDIALTGDGSAYVMGPTDSSDFPTTVGAYQTTFTGVDGSYVLKISPTGALQYSTYFNANDWVRAQSIAVNLSGTPTIVGYTRATNFPTTSGAFDVTLNSGSCPTSPCNTDAFFTTFTNDLSELIYSTYVGGSNHDRGRAIDLDSEGNAIFTGYSESTDFPFTSGAYQTTLIGTRAGFVAKIALPATNVASEGLFSGNVAASNSQSSSNDPTENRAACACATTDNPINTRTGNLAYSTTDISIETQSGNLTFVRNYSSFNARDITVGSLPAGVFSPGWNHNYESRLIFPSDPGGKPNAIVLQNASGSLLTFADNGDGTYSAEAGVGGTFNRAGSPGSYIYTYRNSQDAKYIFNNSGQLTNIDNGLGHQLLLDYDDVSGDLITVAPDTLINPQRFLTFRYDAQGRLIRVGDNTFDDSGPTPTGRYVEYEYDDANNGDLFKAHDVRGQIWKYEYDAIHAHFLSARKDPSLQTLVSYIFDAQGRAIEEKDGNNETIVALTFNPDGTTTLTEGVNGAGGNSTHTYDSRNTLVDTANTAGDAAKRYDANFRPTIVEDANGNRTGLGWSPDGANLNALIDAAGNTTLLAYDSANHVTQITQQDNTVTRLVYNVPGATDPLTGSPIYNPAWDSDLLLVRVDNFVVSGTAPDQNLATRYVYTTSSDAPQPTNLIKKVTGPNGTAVCYAYTQFGQQAAVFQNCVDMVPGPALEDVPTSYIYDNKGHMVATTDALNRTTLYRYLDGDDQVDEVVVNYDGPLADPVNEPVTYLDNTPSNYYRNNGLNNLSSRTYRDRQGRVMATVSNFHPGTIPGGAAFSFNFDGTNVSLQLSTTAPEYNNVTLTRYDEVGRVYETITNYDGSPLTTTSLITSPALANTTDYYKTNGLSIYNLSTRMVYDGASRVAATIANYNPQDFMGGGLPQSLDLDSDTATPNSLQLEISILQPEFNRIGLTRYDSAGRVTRTISNYDGTDLTVAANLYKQDVYNFINVTEYDAAGNVTKSVVNFDPAISDTNANAYTVGLLLTPGSSTLTNVKVDPDVPDRNFITCTQYDTLNRPTFTRTACVPNQIDYLVNNGNVYNVVTYTVYDNLSRIIATVQNYNIAGGTNNSTTIQLVLSNQYNFITRNYYDGLGRASFTVSNFAANNTHNGNVLNPVPPTFETATPDRNLVTHFLYDSQGRQVATVRNEWGNALADNIFTFSESQSSYPDRNLVTRTYYNVHGQVTDVVTNFVSNTLNIVTTTTIPEFDSSTPDRNLITHTEYDILGRAFETTQDRDTEGSRVSHTDYDILGRQSTTFSNYVTGQPDSTWPNCLNDVDRTNVCVHYDYTALGRIVTVTDPAGRVRQSVADALGRNAQSIVDPGTTPHLNLITATTYNSASQVIQTQDASGRKAKIVYNAQGRVTQSIADPTEPDPDVELNLTTSMGYDLMGRVISTSDPRGIVTRTVFNNLGWTLRVIQNAQGATPPCTVPATNDQNVCTQFTNDNAGHLLTRTLGNNTRTDYQYDALGRVRFERIDPTTVNIITESCYDAAGNRIRTIQGGLVSYTVTNGVITNSLCGTADAGLNAQKIAHNYSFDMLGRIKLVDYRNPITGSTFVDTPTVTFTFDAFGNRTTMDDTPGVDGRWTYHYDQMNHLDKVCSGLPDSFTITGAWDGNNCPSAKLVTYTYDGGGNRTGLTFPGQTQSYTYDNASRLKTVSDPFTGGNQVTYGYDGANRVTSVTDGALAAGYTYDTAGRLNQLLNNAGVNNMSSFGYTLDNAGNRTFADESLANFTISSMPSDSPNVAVLMPESALLGMPLDTAAFQSGSQLQPLLDAIDEAWEAGAIHGHGLYNDLRQKVEQAQSAIDRGQCNTALNKLNALLNDLEAQAGQGIDADSAAHLMQLTGEAIDGFACGEPQPTETESPSATPQPTATVQPSSTAVPSAIPTATSVPPATPTPTASATGVPTPTATHTATSTTVPTPTAIQATADSGARVQPQAQNTKTPTPTPTLTPTTGPSPTPTPTPPAQNHWKFEYDNLYRLFKACSNWNGTSCVGTTFNYTYDGAGNLKNFDKWSGTIIQTAHYFYTSANQIRCNDANNSGACGTGQEPTWTYDAYGNLTNDGTRTYTYDAANRLKTSATGGVTTTYTYNGDGNRISQTVGSTVTTYVIDVATPLTMVLSETTGAVTTKYLHGLDVVAQNDGTKIRYFQYDALGSVRQLSDVSGAISLSQTFDPYGNAFSKSGNGTTKFGFTGEQTDSNGFVFLRARYYAPGMGRFLNTDPSRFERNPFLYAIGNPVMFTDPSGLCTTQKCIDGAKSLEDIYHIFIYWPGRNVWPYPKSLLTYFTQCPDVATLDAGLTAKGILSWDEADIENIARALALINGSLTRERTKTLIRGGIFYKAKVQNTPSSAYALMCDNGICDPAVQGLYAATAFAGAPYSLLVSDRKDPYPVATYVHEIGHRVHIVLNRNRSEPIQKTMFWLYYREHTWINHSQLPTLPAAPFVLGLLESNPNKEAYNEREFFAETFMAYVFTHENQLVPKQDTAITQINPIPGLFDFLSPPPQLSLYDWTKNNVIDQIPY